jgi:hypothetical protein
MRFPGSGSGRGPGAVLVLALAVVCLARLAAAPSKGDEILARAADYAAGFVRRFSTIVVEERFVQDARRIGVRPRTGTGRDAGNTRDREVVAAGVTLHRELVSDYLLVKSPDLGAWHTFRDVLEVDGRAVRDRSERLTALFLEPAPAAVQRATEIDREGIRYNLGDPSRTINNPLLVLGFLQAAYRSRFKFSLRDPDPEVGPDVWIVEYREQARPTILRRAPDGDLTARGRLWIEARTGRVLRTELTVSDDDEITASFRFDERFQIAVPVEMREHYWNGNEYVEGIARYDHFREFAVRTEEKIQTEPIR